VAAAALVLLLFAMRFFRSYRHCLSYFLSVSACRSTQYPRRIGTLMNDDAKEEKEEEADDDDGSCSSILLHLVARPTPNAQEPERGRETSVRPTMMLAGTLARSKRSSRLSAG
jgi:hypothetical protein